MRLCIIQRFNIDAFNFIESAYTFSNETFEVFSLHVYNFHLGMWAFIILFNVYII